ncbi:MaoC family dehydratase [Oceanibacterium hippocampi]|uniref:Bifunctional protein PaaZ n=1 Tax=Oceanibacterium hippocampi TaxID=745714 RepID=A0A1Y5SS71_9PROT|nr:MaoC family dehydratase [Oceanibacterium hippocampi]SLN46543.1 Bifunctional protein PaaZ [Oceanibacterium hippocampi]
MAGLWFEEFTVGKVIEHAARRTVTESDNMWFCNATLNTQPLHIDFHFAEKTEFGKPIVNSVFTLGLMIGMGVSETTIGTTVGNLGMTDVNFPRPVFHGDTLHSRTTVLETRESKSRPTNGIVVLLHEAFNQNDELVGSCKRTALMHKRPQA